MEVTARRVMDYADCQALAESFTVRNFLFDIHFLEMTNCCRKNTNK